MFFRSVIEMLSSLARPAETKVTAHRSSHQGTTRFAESSVWSSRAATVAIFRG